MVENRPTVYVKVYQGVEDGLHQFVVQRLQIVVPQLEPLQRVQVVKGVVLNGCNADGENVTDHHRSCHNFCSFKLTGCFEARDSLCVPRNPERKCEDLTYSHGNFEAIAPIML